MSPVSFSASLARPTGASVLIVSRADKLRLTRVYLDSGQTTAWSWPAQARSDADDFSLRRCGQAMVMSAYFTTGAGTEPEPVFIYPTGTPNGPSIVGKATAVIASQRPDRLWLTDQIGSGVAPSAVHLSEIDCAGHPTGSVNLTSPGTGISDIHAVPGGFVAASETNGGPDERIDRYDPTGKPVSQVGPGIIFGVGDSRLLSTTTDGRFWIDDLTTGQRQPVGNSNLDRDSMELSPDGTKVLGIDTSAHPAPFDLIDLTSGTTTVGPPSGLVTWLASGRDLVYADPDGSHLDVWQLPDDQVTRLPLNVGTIEAIAAIP